MGVNMGENMEMMDNSELEELMKMDVNTATADEQNLFIEKFKQSQLIMPVEYSSNMFEDIENAEVGEIFQPQGEAGFNIIYLTDEDGNNVVPLFTSSEMMKKAGVESSAYVLFMSDLADLMEQAGGKYATVAINPFTDLNINMEMGAFINLFRENDMSKVFMEMMELIMQDSVELTHDTALMIHCEENFMKDSAVNGVYQNPMPLHVNSDPHYNEDLKYTNILLFDKSKKVFYIGTTINDEFDTIIAPGTEFEFVKDLDEYTTVWKCGAQPFYDQ